MKHQPTPTDSHHAESHLSPECTLFDALSCLITRGLGAIPVGEPGEHQKTLDASTLVKACRPACPAKHRSRHWRLSLPMPHNWMRPAPQP